MSRAHRSSDSVPSGVLLDVDVWPVIGIPTFSGTPGVTSPDDKVREVTDSGPEALYDQRQERHTTGVSL